jgi:hypothetical protein
MRNTIIMATCVALSLGSAAFAQPYTIDWYTIDGGGAQQLTGWDYILSGTIGQPDAGTHSGGDYILDGGYWGPAAPEGLVCDSIDFNNDGSFFDPVDIDAFLSVFSEGPCVPGGATCNDIDFNNDNSLFDPCDIASFLLVFSEGPCTGCGQ